MKNQKGITLVALVVTIIVLLILAAVSLSLVAGSDGLLNRASNAVDKTTVESARERTELAIETEIANYYEKKYVSNVADTSTISLVQYVANAISGMDVGNSATASVTTDSSNNVTVTIPGQATLTGTLTTTGNLTWNN